LSDYIIASKPLAIGGLPGFPGIYTFIGREGLGFGPGLHFGFLGYFGSIFFFKSGLMMSRSSAELL